MKIRQILALVLALVMCVLMCACSNESEDNDDSSTGTSSKYKKYAKYADLFELLEDEDYAGAIQAIIAMKNESEKEDENQEEEGNEEIKKFSPVGKYIVTERYDDDFTYNYLTYNEDGSITLGDEETLLVTEISRNENRVDFNIVDNDKYSRISFSREESGLVSCNVGGAHFSRIDQNVPGEIFSEFAGNWVCYDGNTKDFLQLELYDDFKVTINNETYSWTASSSGENVIKLSAYNKNLVEAYRLEIVTSEVGISYVYLIDKIDDIGVGYYYKNKVINALVYSGYRAFDNEVEDDFISIRLEGSFDGIDDMNYWQLVSSDENSVVGNIYDEKNPNNPAYTFTLKMENGYPQLYLTNIASKTETIYFNQGFWFDTDNNSEYLYHFARKHLAECLKGYSYVPEGYNSYVSGSEYLKYIHGIFSKIKDYKDVSEYLAKFTIVKNALTDVTHTYKNVFDNPLSSKLLEYTYDSNGLIKSIYFMGGSTVYAEPLYEYGVSFDASSYTKYNFKYDDNGRISYIYVGDEDNISKKSVPVYDENGRIISTHTTTTMGEYTSTLTYDSSGRLIKVEFTYPNSEYTSIEICEYTYNADGTLASYVKTDTVKYTRGYSEVRTYKVTYNYNNGSLDTAHYVYTYDTNVSDPKVESDIEYTFSYNENGCISEVASKYNTAHNYTDDKHVYTYNDIYFYAE